MKINDRIKIQIIISGASADMSEDSFDQCFALSYHI